MFSPFSVTRRHIEFLSPRDNPPPERRSENMKYVAVRANVTADEHRSLTRQAFRESHGYLRSLFSRHMPLPDNSSCRVYPFWREITLGE